ncbi:MAG: alginate export family protein [bacterium]
MKSKSSIIFLAFIYFTQPALSQTRFTISGELRSRVEGRDNADFNSERLDGTLFVLNRVRVGFFREWENGIDVFVQLQDSRLWGEEGSSLTALGSRAKTKLLDRLDLEIEGTYQLGNRGPLNVRAFGFAVESKYTLPSKMRSTALAGYTYGSGDSNSNDAKLETFSNFFPDAHSYLGKMDYVGWSNISAFYFGGAVQPARHFEIGARAYFFALADGNDAFYRAEGYRIGSPAEIYRSAVAGVGTDVGREVDLFAKFLYRDRIDLTFGFSSFFVGKFLENTGGLRADDSFFGYFSVAVNF